MRILIMAGGTGGHIFPALAVAKRMQKLGHTVRWLGSSYGMESEITRAHAIPIYLINIVGLRGKGIYTKLLAPIKLLYAFWQSILVMCKYKPDLVLGMGGYVTGPAGLAAWVMRKRLVIHEQNAIAGMTNRLLARMADSVLTGFAQSFPKSIATINTGNPIREEFYIDVEKPNNIDSRLKILIIGGSAGARALNNLLPQLLKNWPGAEKPLIWHQAGKKNLIDAQNAYKNNGFDPQIFDNVKLVDFIEDMPQAYRWADVIICRAGALTVAEITAIGVSSILIPYPYAVDDHQTKNAKYLEDNGAAIIIQEKDLDLQKLINILVGMQNEPKKLENMAKAAKELAKPLALDTVVAQLVNT